MLADFAFCFYDCMAPDLGWLAHLLVRLQSIRLLSLRLQSRGTRFGLGSPSTRSQRRYIGPFKANSVLGISSSALRLLCYTEGAFWHHREGKYVQMGITIHIDIYLPTRMLLAKSWWLITAKEAGSTEKTH